MQTHQPLPLMTRSCKEMLAISDQSKDRDD
jgi:hypothetical protein